MILPIPKKRILALALVLTASSFPLFPDCWKKTDTEGAVPVSAPTETERIALPDGVFFFGESTTAHLARTGGVLCQMPLCRRVFRDAGGTRTLDRRTLHSPVDHILPDGTRVTRPVSEAVAAEQPRVLVLSFGINGLLDFSEHPDRFLANYRRLIEGFHALSPDTRMLLQSVYPVGENKVFSLECKALNQKIDTLNDRVRDLAESIPYAEYRNTAVLLKDRDGMLCREYDIGDGIHLTNQAYEKILSSLFEFE